MRPWKNPDVNDQQRARNLRRRIMEERSIAESIWQTTEPVTDDERCVDFLHYRQYEVERRRLEKQGKRGIVYTDRNIGVRMNDHITSRILSGVLWPNAFNQGRYPLNETEKNRDHLGRTAVAAIISDIRKNVRFGMLSILTDLLHTDRDTNDRDNIIFEARTEKKSKKKRERIEDFPQSHPILVWLRRKRNIRNSASQRVQMTLDNFLRSEAETIVLERIEQTRRRRRREGGGIT